MILKKKILGNAEASIQNPCGEFHVYKHINPDSNECVYIGSGLEHRRASLCRRSVEHTIWLEDILQGKALKEVVHTLFVFDNKGEARKKEAELIAELKPKFNKYHNPDWSFSEDYKSHMSKIRKGHKLSEETKRKMSEAKSGKNNPAYSHGRDIGKKESKWNR